MPSASPPLHYDGYVVYNFNPPFLDANQQRILGTQRHPILVKSTQVQSAGISARRLVLASFALVVYDHIIMFAQEATFWSGSWSTSRVLYLMIRYLALISFIFYGNTFGHGAACVLLKTRDRLIGSHSQLFRNQTCFFIANYTLAFVVMTHDTLSMCVQVVS